MELDECFDAKHSQHFCENILASEPHFGIAV
jgi:hypothetical protein